MRSGLSSRSLRVSGCFSSKLPLSLDYFQSFLSRKDNQTDIKSNDYSEKLYFVPITHPQRTPSSRGLRWMPIWSNKQGKLLRNTMATMMILEPLEYGLENTWEKRIDQLDPSYRGWLLKTQLRGPYRTMIRNVSVFTISSNVQGKLISVVRRL